MLTTGRCLMFGGSGRATAPALAGSAAGRASPRGLHGGRRSAEDYSPSFTALSFSSGAAEAEPSSFKGSPSPTLSEGSTLPPILPGLSEGSTRFLLIEVFSFLKLHHALVAWEGKCSVVNGFPLVRTRVRRAARVRPEGLISLRRPHHSPSRAASVASSRAGSARRVRGLTVGRDRGLLPTPGRVARRR